MKKVIIAQPMAGKTEDQIREERKPTEERIIAFGGRVIDTIFQEDAKPLEYLALSLEAIANCDLVVLMAGWENARGCRIEHSCCEDYGIPHEHM